MKHIKPYSQMNEGSGPYTPIAEMMDKLRKRFPNVWIKDGALFGKEKAGSIWTGAESSTWIDDAKKVPAFNVSGAYAYNPVINKNYTDEVHNKLYRFLQENGWYCESHDAATFFFWPIDPKNIER